MALGQKQYKADQGLLMMGQENKSKETKISIVRSQLDMLASVKIIVETQRPSDLAGIWLEEYTFFIQEIEI